MNEDFTHKLEIAIEHLTVALRLFLETKEYYASLHLAGAAEELFKKI